MTTISAALVDPLPAPELAGEAPEALIILLTRCGCTRVLGPAPASGLPEFVEVKLLSVPGALIEPGKEGGEARRFRLAANGVDMLKKLGMVLQGPGEAIPQAVYLEVLTYGTRAATVVRGVRVPGGPGSVDLI